MEVLAYIAVCVEVGNADDPYEVREAVAKAVAEGDYALDDWESVTEEE